MDERHYIYRCLELVEEKFDKGRSRFWTDKTFKLLSSEIYNASSITISANTLKRLFGKMQSSQNYSPQEDTKTALAIYTGYKNWDDFRQSFESNEEYAYDIERKHSVPFKILNKPLIFTVLSIILIGIISFWYYFLPDYDYEYEFDVKNNKGDAPMNAVFNYDISHIKDSVFIDFGKGNRIVLPDTLHTITHNYYIPGFYQGKLIANGKVLEHFDILVKSKGWTAEVVVNLPDKMNTYRSKIYKRTMEGINGLLYIPIDSVYQLDIKKGTKFLTDFHNYKEFNINADSMTFVTRAMNNDHTEGKVRKMNCNDIKIWLYGSSGVIYFHFVEPGCIESVSFKIGEIDISGVYHVLSDFGRNLDNWNTFKLNIKAPRAEIWFNEQKSMDTTYKQKIGELMGIKYSFKGSGKVDYVKILDQKNEVKFHNDFEN